MQNVEDLQYILLVHADRLKLSTTFTLCIPEIVIIELVIKESVMINFWIQRYMYIQYFGHTPRLEETMVFVRFENWLHPTSPLFCTLRTCI